MKELTMFEIQLMTGAMALTAIQVVVTVGFLLLLGHSLYKLWLSYQSNPAGVYGRNKKRVWFTAFLVLLGFIITTQSTLQPKRVIDLPVNREQVEYDSPKDVEIVTPEPRTETLQGFRPLGE